MLKYFIIIKMLGRKNKEFKLRLHKNAKNKFVYDINLCRQRSMRCHV